MPPINTDPAGLPRIRRLARLVRLLSLLGAAVLLLLPPLFWSQPDWVARVARQQWFAGTTLQLDGAARWGGLAASSLPVAVGLWALWEIWQLFGCFGRGELLARAPAGHLQRLGLAVMAQAAAQPLGQTLAVLALTLGNPPGQRQLVFDLSADHYMSLLFGLVLLALASVIREAARVADENASFV